MNIKIFTTSRAVALNYNENFGTQNENDATEIKIAFDKDMSEYTAKRIVFITPDGNKQDAIMGNDNTYKIKNSITKYSNVKAYIWLTNKEGKDFRTEEFEINFLENENADEYVPTEEQIDVINTLITTINTKIAEVQNLDLELAEVEDGVKLTITKKDGTSESRTVKNGADGKDYEITSKDYEEIAKLVDVPKKTSELINDSNFVEDSDYVHTDNNYTTEEKEKLAELENYNDTEIKERITTIENKQETDESNINSNTNEINSLKTNVNEINSKIPSQATSENQLADKDFVNSSLNSITAFYITKNADGEQFNSKAELDNATQFYSGGELREPTRNDYCIVLVDETRENSTTRYIYQNGQWEFQYIVNETALTSEQIKALNSGITVELVAKLIGIDLTNYIKNTDYATSYKSGVVITIDDYAVGTNDVGYIYAKNLTNEQYNAISDFAFISKGTFKNVLNAVVGDINTLLDSINGEVI